MNKPFAGAFYALLCIGAVNAAAYNDPSDQNVSVNGMVHYVKQAAQKYGGKMIYAKNALFKAAAEGDYTKTKKLLEAGKDDSATTDGGINPLMLAISNNHFYVARLLTEHAGPKTLNQQDHYGLTPLMYAVRYNMPEIIAPLARAGAEINLQDNQGRTAIALSVQLDSVPLFRALQGVGADTTRLDAYGNTLLMLAILKSEDSALRLLQNDNHQNLTAVNQEGESAFLMAMKRRYHRLAEQLLANSQVQASLKDTDEAGNTPLANALWNKDPEGAVLLYKYGADPLTQNINGQTPLTVAVNYPQVLRLFLQDETVRRAATELKDKQGHPAATIHAPEGARKVFEEFGIELSK